MSEVSIIALGSGKPSGKISPLLKRGLDLTGKDKAPNVLVIPTAKTTREAHDKSTADTALLYQERLKVPYRVLHGFGEMPARTELDEHLNWADVVYVTGGDTARMMEIWKQHGITTILGSRALNGLVLTGVSAGAIAPFVWGHSDSISYRVRPGEQWNYMQVRGVGILEAAITPHYNTAPNGQSRAEAFIGMLKRTTTRYGLGLDNLAGIEINNEQMTVLSAKTGAGVTLHLNQAGKIEKEQLGANEVIDVNELLP